MTLEEVLNLIDEDKREEAATVINSMIEAEKEKGITTYRKKNKESIKYKNIIRDLGYNPDDYSSYDEFKETVLDKMNKAETSMTEIEKLNQKIATLTEAYEEERKIRTQKEQESQKIKIQNKLKEALSPKLYGADYLIENLLNKGEFVIEDDNIVSKDGLPFDAKIEKIIESNKDNLKEEKKTTPGVVKQTNVREANDLKSLLKNEMESIKSGVPTASGIKLA